jgi:hypothetical protein
MLPSLSQCCKECLYNVHVGIYFETDLNNNANAQEFSVLESAIQKTAEIMPNM